MVSPVDPDPQIPRTIAGWSPYIISAVAVLLGRALATSKDRDRGINYPNILLTIISALIMASLIFEYSLSPFQCFLWSLGLGFSGELIVKPMLEKFGRAVKAFNMAPQMRDDPRLSGVKALDDVMKREVPQELSEEDRDFVRRLAEREKGGE